MSEDPSQSNTPLVLLINDEEWTSRSIESILKPEGFAVLRAYTGQQGLELASRMKLDLLLIDLRLPDVTGIDLCAQVRKLATVRPSTPIIVFSSGPIRRSEKLAAMSAGAWAVLDPPLDPQELLALMTPFIGAKRDADLALEMSYVDPLTGIYNVQGLMRRVSEMSGDTTRSQRPLACVVLGPSSPESEGTEHAEGPTFLTSPQPVDPEVTRELGHMILSVTRLSDAVGRVGENNFVIMAPGTDEAGAQRLAERVMQVVDGARADNKELRDVDLRAGLYVLSGTEPDTLIPEEFLRRATSALRGAQSGSGNGSNGSSRIRPFQEN
jgi:PleD family two-component response regulator